MSTDSGFSANYTSLCGTGCRRKQAYSSFKFFYVRLGRSSCHKRRGTHFSHENFCFTYGDMETNPIHTAQFPELVIIDVHPNPGDYQDLVAVLATGHSQEESCALLLFNCLTQTETVRWAGTLKEGNAPVAGKRNAFRPSLY